VVWTSNLTNDFIRLGFGAVDTRKSKLLKDKNPYRCMKWLKMIQFAPYSAGPNRVENTTVSR